MSQFHLFVDVFDQHLLVPGRVIRWFGYDEVMYDGVVTEVVSDYVIVSGPEIGEVRLPIDEITHVGWTDMGSNRREDFKPEVLVQKEPAVFTPAPIVKKQITANLVIAKYLETRDLIEAKTKALNAELADLKAIQGRREQWLTAEMDRIGTDTLKMKAIGTSFFEKASSATVADGPTFMAWVGEDFEARKTYLENRVSKTAVKQGLDDNIPPPPGINYTTVRVLRVRRA